MEWLTPVIPALKEQITKGRPIRMLEVGALIVMNACSKGGFLEVERIDLNSQAEGITAGFHGTTTPPGWNGAIRYYLSLSSSQLCFPML
jgi:hypothetical protein